MVSALKWPPIAIIPILCSIVSVVVKTELMSTKVCIDSYLHWLQFPDFHSSDSFHYLLFFCFSSNYKKLFSNYAKNFWLLLIQINKKQANHKINDYSIHDTYLCCPVLSSNYLLTLIKVKSKWVVIRRSFGYFFHAN